MEADSLGDFLRQTRPLVEGIVRAVVNVVLPLEQSQAAATSIILDVIDPRTIKRADRITPSNSEGYVTVGLNHASAGREILMELKRVGYTPNDGEAGTIKDLSSGERIKLMIDTASKVASGAGKFIQQNADPEAVDLYPALELERFYDREMPEESWPNRWLAAAAGLEDGERILAALKKTDRMVALKSSRIWQALGDGSGGYEDAVGNPWPPFAFNSGFGVKSISRFEAIELGLLAKGEVSKPAMLPTSDEIATRLAKKLREYLARLEDEEQKRRSDPLTFCTSDELLELAQQKIQSAANLTPEHIQEIKSLVEKTFEKGLDAEFNLRARGHKLLMNIYDQLQEPEKAESHRQQYVQNASGFMLLNDAQIQIDKLGGRIELETGARILDLLTKAVQMIPENCSDKHAEAYRATAEVLEAIGDAAQAVEYYEYALQKNPNIHVKRRLNALKKKLSPI
jgi:tetratricopeptide (TPR) repeat protein